jgi:hypothetical protein
MKEKRKKVEANVAAERGVVIFPAYLIGHSELLYFLKSMENQGLLDRVLPICSADFINSTDLHPPYYIIDNFKSFAAIIEKLDMWSKLHGLPFRGVMGIDEEEQFRISRGIAKHYGLDFYQGRTCFRSSNKYLLKTFFKQYQVPIGKYTLLSNPVDPEIRRVGFPNVLKPVSGTGSQFIFLNENMEQLERNFHLLSAAALRTDGDGRFNRRNVTIDGKTFSINPRKQFLLEQFIDGDEYSCDFLIRNNQVQIIRIVKKLKGPYFGLFSAYHLLTLEGLEINGIDLMKLMSLCRGISRAFSIEQGVCMVDFKMNDGKFKVLESSVRPGLSAFNHLMYEIYGYTSLAVLARLKMGIPTDIQFPGESGSVIYIYNWQEEILRNPGFPFDILHIHQFENEEGPVIDPDFDRSQYLKGYVLLKNIEEKKLPEVAAYLNGETSTLEENG